MTAGMFLASTARGVEPMSVFRFMTGLGIGGMLAAINAVAAECANNRRRNLAVTLMATGYPLGAVFGGMIATRLLAGGDWRSVFMFGTLATAVCIPLVLWLMPESVSYLVERRPAKALARVNSTLRRLGHRSVGSLPPASAATGARAGSFTELFSPQLARATILLTLAYFAHIMTFYFILKWIPKIVVDMGFEPASAGGVLVWANVGGASGALALQPAHSAHRSAQARDRRAGSHGGDGRVFRPLGIRAHAALDAGRGHRVSSATQGSSVCTRCSRSPSRRRSARAAPAS